MMEDLLNKIQESNDSLMALLGEEMILSSSSKTTTAGSNNNNKFSSEGCLVAGGDGVNSSVVDVNRVRLGLEALEESLYVRAKLASKLQEDKKHEKRRETKAVDVAGASSLFFQQTSSSYDLDTTTTKDNQDGNRSSGSSSSGGSTIPMTDCIVTASVDAKNSKAAAAAAVAASKRRASQKGAERIKTQVAAPRYWTATEHELFLTAAEEFGFVNVEAIAGRVKTRTVEQVKVHIKKYMDKLKRDGVISGDVLVIPKNPKDRAFGRSRAPAKCDKPTHDDDDEDESDWETAYLNKRSGRQKKNKRKRGSSRKSKSKNDDDDDDDENDDEDEEEEEDDDEEEEDDENDDNVTLSHRNRNSNNGSFGAGGGHNSCSSEGDDDLRSHSFFRAVSLDVSGDDIARSMLAAPNGAHVWEAPPPPPSSFHQNDDLILRYLHPEGFGKSVDASARPKVAKTVNPSPANNKSRSGRKVGSFSPRKISCSPRSASPKSYGPPALISANSPSWIHMNSSSSCNNSPLPTPPTAARELSNGNFNNNNNLPAATGSVPCRGMWNDDDAVFNNRKAYSGDDNKIALTPTALTPMSTTSSSSTPANQYGTAAVQTSTASSSSSSSSSCMPPHRKSLDERPVFAFGPSRPLPPPASSSSALASSLPSNNNNLGFVATVSSSSNSNGNGGANISCTRVSLNTEDQMIVDDGDAFSEWESIFGAKASCASSAGSSSSYQYHCFPNNSNNMPLPPPSSSSQPSIFQSRNVPLTNDTNQNRNVTQLWDIFQF